jgi:predicted  nucleic acid-binding Zn-ribbon protein
MSTTQIAAILFQLQQLDLELDRLSAEQQAIRHSLQGNRTLQKLRSEYQAAQQQVQVALQAQKEAEWALEDINRRLKAQEQRLYNGTVVNAKELQSLQQEVQNLRAQQGRQEDTVLEVIDNAESLQEMAQQKLTALQEAEETWKRESSSLIARSDQLEAHTREVRQKRAQLTSTVEAELIERYDKMRRTKQGRAVSRVEQNSCQWCRVILTPSELQHVRMSSELQTCTNCGRILYYDR